MAPKKIVPAAQIKDDIARIIKKLDGEAEDGQVVHLIDSDPDFIKVYQFKGTAWQFMKRITKEEADDESSEDDNATEKPTQSKDEQPTDEQPTEKKKILKKEEKSVKPKPEKKKKAMFTLTDLKDAVQNNKTEALVMIDVLIEKFGADILTIKKTKRQADPNKPKSEYHQFMAEKLGEMKGNKDIPVNERMQHVSKMWKEKKTATQAS